MVRPNEARYQDTDEVRQWMANSATASTHAVGDHCNSTFNLAYTNAVSKIAVPTRAPGSCTTTTNSACAFPPLSLASIGNQNGLGINFESMNTSDAGFAVPGTDDGFDIPLDCSLAYTTVPGEQIPMDYNASMAHFSLPSPGYDDMQSCDSVNSQIIFVEGNAANTAPGWEPQGGNESLTRATSPGSQPMDWSNSGFTNSVESSNSLDSFMQLPDTPLSMTMLEDTWSVDRMVAPNGPDCFSRLATAAESTQYPSASYSNDQRFELCRHTGLHVSDFRGSTMKPNRTFQRPPIPTMDMWPQPQYGQAYVTPPYRINNSRRQSEEGTLSARKDARYQVQRQEDNMYHCPFEDEGCTHKPESLKCNYE